MHPRTERINFCRTRKTVFPATTNQRNVNFKTVPILLEKLRRKGFHVYTTAMGKQSNNFDENKIYNE